MFHPTKRVCLFASLLAVGVANATTNIELDLSDVTQAADAIVTGEVVSTETTMQGKSPQTLVTVRVTDELKGDTAETITILVPGGNYKSGRFRIGEVHAGSPQTFVNQSNFYFLNESAESGAYRVVGFNQGVIAIEDETSARGLLTHGQAIPVAEMKARIAEMGAN